MVKLTFLLLGLFVLSSVWVVAIPLDLDVNGFLVNSTNGTVTSEVNLTFRLYTVASGGTAFYEQNKTLTPDAGYFSSILNSTQSAWFNNTIYLGITVNSDSELSPRLQFTSVPYAHQAGAINCSNIYGGSDGDFCVDAGASGGNTTEEIQDAVGTMVTGNTEQNISVTYDDAGDEFDFIVTLTSFNWNDLTNVPAGFADGTDDDTVYSDTGLVANQTNFLINVSNVNVATINNVTGGNEQNISVSHDGGFFNWIVTLTSFNWNDLTNVPAGFADGIDDVGSAGSSPFFTCNSFLCVNDSVSAATGINLTGHSIMDGINSTNVNVSENLSANRYKSYGGSLGFTLSQSGDDLILLTDVEGVNSFFIETAGTFLELIANPGPAVDDLMFSIEETQGDNTAINFYEGGSGNNRFWNSGSTRMGGGPASTCSTLAPSDQVDCDTGSTGADLVVQDMVWTGGGIMIDNGTTNITSLHFNSTLGFLDADGVDSGNSTEEVQDAVGTMVTGNTEQNISVTYDDASNVFDFIVTLTSFNWNELTNVPAGFADGIDDVGGAGSSPLSTCASFLCINDTVSSATGFNWTGKSIGSALNVSLLNVSTLLDSIAYTESGSNTLSNDISGNAATATALAANGANCGAGNYPLGVDASGAVESCTADQIGQVSNGSIQINSTQVGNLTRGVNLTVVGNGSVSYNVASNSLNLVINPTIGWNGITGKPNIGGWNIGNAVLTNITGRVGIGLASPIHRLHLTGSGNSSDWFNASRFSGSGALLTSLNADNIASGTLADARLSFTLQDAVDDGGCTDCITDAMVSNTLTASNLIAGSSVVADSEVDNDLTINGGTLSGSNTISNGMRFSGTPHVKGNLTIIDASNNNAVNISVQNGYWCIGC